MRRSVPAYLDRGCVDDGQSAHVSVVERRPHDYELPGFDLTVHKGQVLLLKCILFLF